MKMRNNSKTEHVEKILKKLVIKIIMIITIIIIMT